MNEQVWCPLSFSSPTFPDGEWSRCVREQCAWWHSGQEKCAVLVLAETRIRSEIREIRTAERRIRC